MNDPSATLYNWEQLPLEKLNDKIGRKLVTSDKMMVAHVYLEKGAVVPQHKHHNEQITYVLKGALKFLLGGEQLEEVIVRAGEVLVIPSNLPHSAVALIDTLDVDIFNPPREDWLDGSDSYLREATPTPQTNA
jgi:quercetin dioxygenase-like cupin family protein